eukprot:scaffold416683_cov42-Prasinocladus_malaysianus.AAC.1
MALERRSDYTRVVEDVLALLKHIIPLPWSAWEPIRLWGQSSRPQTNADSGTSELPIIIRANRLKGWTHYAHTIIRQHH